MGVSMSDAAERRAVATDGQIQRVPVPALRRGHSPGPDPGTEGSSAFGDSGFSFIWGQPLSTWGGPEMFGTFLIK